MKVGGVGTVIGQLRGLPVPEGWVKCDGACYSRESFPELFDMLRNNRFPSDPVDHFRVPDDRQALPPGSLVMLIVKAG